MIELHLEFFDDDSSKTFLVRWWVDPNGGNNTVLLCDSIARSVTNNKIDIVSISGARVQQLHTFINQNLSVLNYENIIVMIGGNNLSDWKGQRKETPEKVYSRLYNMMRQMKQRQDTNVFVLGVAPRLATNQNPSLDKEINSLNNFIRCSYENQPATAKMFQFVSLQRFFAGNFRFLLEQDGVHVNEKGIKNLIRIIHHRVLRINLLPNKSRKAKKLSHKRFNKSVL